MLKNLGFAGVIISAIVMFFPKLRELFSGFLGGGAEAGEGVTAPQTSQSNEPVTQNAPELMQSWKQSMEEAYVPEAVQRTILANEAAYTQQLASAKTQGELAQIQMNAYAQATAPHWKTFENNAKAQLTQEMDETIKFVQETSGISDKDRKAAIDGLQKQKTIQLKKLSQELGSISDEQKIQLVLNPEAQDQVIGNITKNTKAFSEEVKQNAADMGRNNNGWAWASSISGWASLGLGLGALAAAPFTAGASIPLALTAGACITGAAAGTCRVVNNSGKYGSNFDFGLGIAEIGLSAIPVIGMGGRAASMVAKGTTEAVRSGTSLTSALKGLGSMDGIKAAFTHGKALSLVENTADAMKISLGATAKSEAIQEITHALKGVEGAVTTMSKGDALEVATRALSTVKKSDVLLTTSWGQAGRALKAMNYTTTPGTIGEMIPSSTPENIVPGSPSKTTLLP